MIRRLLVILFLVFIHDVSAKADTRSLYTVKDIKVSETGENVIEAQQTAFSVARRLGAQRMIERITLPEARIQAGGVAIDNQLGASLAAAVDVQEETRGGGRYVATLSVVLNPAAVRTYLKSRNIPYIDTQAPLSLLVPVGSMDIIGEWQKAWGERDDGKLAPYVTGLSPYTETATWDDISGEVGSSRARRGVVARLNGVEGSYSVTLTLLTAGTVTDLGTTARARNIEDAVGLATEKLDDIWRRDSIINSSERTLSVASVRYTSLAEWNTLRGQLPRSPLVTDFQIKAVSSDGAVVEFAFAGDKDRLMADLRQRGIMLETTVGGFVMRSAVSGAR